jgi:hypothetical protein
MKTNGHTYNIYEPDCLNHKYHRLQNNSVICASSCLPYSTVMPLSKSSSLEKLKGWGTEKPSRYFGILNKGSHTIHYLIHKNSVNFLIIVKQDPVLIK